MTTDRAKAGATITAPEPTAALLSAEQAAGLCGLSRSGWYKLCSAGRTPAPVRLGRRTLWRTAELRAWIAAGCPTRHKWEAMQAETEWRR